jgi:diguanylate cyclase (GGDEF)-like protein/PAS domain S-box-containing protein
MPRHFVKRSRISVNKIFLKFAFMVLVLLLLGCQTSPESQPPTLEPVILQLKWKHQFQFAGYYAALEQGYYQDAGLEVQLVEAPDDGTEPALKVLQGEADFGIASSDLLLLYAKDEPVVALAAIYQHSPLIWLSLQDRGIGSIHDFHGKTVMLETHAAELVAYLQSEGMSINNLTQLPHSFDPDALIQGQVSAMSAYSTDEPFLVQQAGLQYQIFNPRASGIDFYGDTLFTTQSQIKNHPERVAAFLDASLKGWGYALDHPEEMVDLIYSDYSQRHSRQHLLFEAEQTKRLILPDVVETGYLNPGRWQRIAEIYSDLHMAPADLDLDGFLYDRNPKPNLTWFYLSLLGSLVVLGVSFFISARFYRLNNSLHEEMRERAQVEDHLRVLEKRYRVLVENAPFPIVISSLEECTMLYINPQAATKYEISQSHAVGKSALDFYVDPLDREKILTLLDRHGFMQNFEVQHITAGGQKFWADISANLIVFEEQSAIFSSIVDITERRDLAIRLEEIAMKDELTSLANRRHFMQKIHEEVNRAKRYQATLSLMLLDIDNLKEINDTHGHAAGDQVLHQIAKTFNQNLRQFDFSGRLGGDEFGVILPNTSQHDAVQLAERLRRIFANQVIEMKDEEIQFTMSIGLTVLAGLDDAIDDLFRRADQALYKAKNSGRNLVEIDLKE